MKMGSTPTGIELTGLDNDERDAALRSHLINSGRSCYVAFVAC